MIQEFGSSPRWIPGVIVSSTGPVSYTIKLEDGRVVRRHIDHVRDRSTPESSASPPTSDPIEDFGFFPVLSADTSAPPSRQEPQPEEPARRYPQRDRHPPERLMHFHI